MTDANDTIEKASSPLVLKAVCHTGGDGWKDSRKVGDVVFVWDIQLPPPYAPLQYPVVNNPIRTINAEDWNISPVTEEDKRYFYHVLALQAPLAGLLEGDHDEHLRTLAGSDRAAAEALVERIKREVHPDSYIAYMYPHVIENHSKDEPAIDEIGDLGQCCSADGCHKRGKNGKAASCGEGCRNRY